MAHDIARDAERVVDTLARGGVAIFPADVGYAVVGNHEAAIARIFAAKQRSFEKQCGMFTNWVMFEQLALVNETDRALVHSLIHRHRLPISVVAPYRSDHLFFAGLTPLTRERSSRKGTIDMLMNAGALHDAIAALSWARRLPVLGSSANRSLTGSKYRAEDVEPEVRAAADLVLDYGPTRYDHPEGMGSTILEMGSLKPIRRGILFDRICDIARDETGIDPRRVA